MTAPVSEFGTGTVVTLSVYLHDTFLKRRSGGGTSKHVGRQFRKSLSRASVGNAPATAPPTEAVHCVKLQFESDKLDAVSRAKIAPPLPRGAVQLVKVFPTMLTFAVVLPPMLIPPPSPSVAVQFVKVVLRISTSLPCCSNKIPPPTLPVQFSRVEDSRRTDPQSATVMHPLPINEEE